MLIANPNLGHLYNMTEFHVVLKVVFDNQEYHSRKKVTLSLCSTNICTTP
jgi:hypothetical protein